MGVQPQGNSFCSLPCRRFTRPFLLLFLLNQVIWVPKVLRDFYPFTIFIYGIFLGARHSRGAIISGGQSLRPPAGYEPKGLRQLPIWQFTFHPTNASWFTKGCPLRTFFTPHRRALARPKGARRNFRFKTDFRTQSESVLPRARSCFTTRA